MNVGLQLTDADIRRARKDNPKLRERDLSTNLGISEARYIAAWIGQGVRRLRCDLDGILGGLAAVGEVMALTRNAYAVHEKTGDYEDYRPGEHVAMVLGPAVDLRIFTAHWVHAFAVEKMVGESALQSIQIFDAYGDAVHKVFTRDATDRPAWDALVAALEKDAPQDALAIKPKRSVKTRALDALEAEVFRNRWETITDTHEIAGLVRQFGIAKADVGPLLQPDFAWQLQPSAVDTLLQKVAEDALPVMLFVRNPGCLQVHSGPIRTLKQVGPWLNVMDPDFHLHLRTDKIAALWAIRKPTSRGEVLSVEAFAADGTPIILINGQPDQSMRSNDEWRAIIDTLPPTT